MATFPMLEVVCGIVGLRRGHRLRIRGERLVLGRALTADLMISGLQPEHCALVWEKSGEWRLVELMGKGQTLLNWRPPEGAPLEHGDRIEAGPGYVMRFLLREPTPEDRRTEPQIAPRLEVLTSGDWAMGSTIPIESSAFVIGRTDGYHGTGLLVEHQPVARAQCRISLHDGSWRLENLASHHGTVLNGDRVQGTAHLRHADLLELPDGSCFRFLVAPRVAPGELFEAALLNTEARAVYSDWLSEQGADSDLRRLGPLAGPHRRGDVDVEFESGFPVRLAFRGPTHTKPGVSFDKGLRALSQPEFRFVRELSFDVTTLFPETWEADRRAGFLHSLSAMPLLQVVRIHGRGPFPGLEGAWAKLKSTQPRLVTTLKTLIAPGALKF